MRRHFFHFQPVRDRMRIKADGAPQNVVVFNFLVQGPHGNAEHTGHFFDRESFLSGAQLLDEGHFLNFFGLARLASGAGAANPRSFGRAMPGYQSESCALFCPITFQPIVIHDTYNRPPAKVEDLG
jgi:hypothetical protein